MRILTRKQFQDDMAKMWSEAVEAEYKAQIEAAVLEEREACAQAAAVALLGADRELAERVVRAIRARGQA